MCPLSSVTSRALHSFILQGQIPVTDPGGQKAQACWVLLAATIHLAQWQNGRRDDDMNQRQNYGRQTWSGGSYAQSVNLIRRRPATAINGLKSNTAWATHYPPSQNYTLTWGRFISYPLVQLVPPHRPPLVVTSLLPIWISGGTDCCCWFAN